MSKPKGIPGFPAINVPEDGFEYQVVDVSGDGLRALATTLNGLAKDGWRLICCTPRAQLILERPCPAQDGKTPKTD